jgi:hypothetical protein
MNMGDELKKRFFQKRLDDMLTNNIHLRPTILCEMDDPRITEMVRPYCCLKGILVPFRVGDRLNIVSERIDYQRGSVNWGQLYIDVNIN